MLTKLLKQQQTQGDSELVYPDRMIRLPSFAEEVNNFIEERARRDLPVEQFLGRVSCHNPGSLVEIGGFLGYNPGFFGRDGQLTELNYSPPSESIISVYAILPGSNGRHRMEIETWDRLYGGSRPPLSYTSKKKIGDPPLKEIGDSKNLIQWHTHPSGIGHFSDGDKTAWRRVCERIPNKPVYFLIFSPEYQESTWYEMRRRK